MAIIRFLQAGGHRVIVCYYRWLLSCYKPGIEGLKGVPCTWIIWHGPCQCHLDV